MDNLLSSANITRPDPAPDEHLGGVDLEADIVYSRRVAAMYFSQGPLGSVVAELGPGGSAAVALHLLASGCDRVDLIDRFEIHHDAQRQARMYAKIIAEDPALRSRFQGSTDLEPYVRAYVGEEAAAEVFFDTHRGYDAIVSCAVLEHLYDPIDALKRMTAALKPGGRLLHQVDLRDHGMFSAGGHHELTFLTIPSWLYPHMTRRRGRPNRVLFHRYRRTLESLGLEFGLRVTHLVGVGAIEPMEYGQIPAGERLAAVQAVRAIRARLSSDLRDVSDEDLSVACFFLAAAKPALGSEGD